MEYDRNRFRPVFQPEEEVLEYDPNRFVPIDQVEKQEAPLRQAVRGVGKGTNVGLSDVVNILPNALHAGATLLGQGITAIDNRITGNQNQFNPGQSPGAASRRLLTQAGLGYEDFNELPQAERIGAAAGEALGASVPFAALPFALGRAGMAAASPMVQAAQNAPRTTAAAELASASGAAQGAAIATSIAPESDLARAGGELIGAAINPSTLFLKVGKKGTGAIINSIRRLTSTGYQETEAGNHIARILETFGHDKESVISMIEGGMQNLADPSYRPTTAQLTDIDGLIGLESKVSSMSPQAGSAIARQREEASQVLRGLADGLAATGDPQNLIVAAQIRQAYFDDLLRNRVAAAQQGAERTARPFDARNPQSQMDASESVVGAIRDAFDDAIKVQTQLWDKIPKNIVSDGSNTLRALQSAQRQVLPNQSPISSDYMNFLDEAAETGQIVSRNLLILRRDFLERQSRALAQGSTAEANRYGELAEGVLRDLDAVPGDVAEIAREFSNSMHRTFHDTFAGRAIGLGGPSIEPGLALSRGLGSRGDAAAVRSQQMLEATTFDRPQSGFEAPPERRAIVREGQQDWLREQVGELFNAETGRISTARAARYLEKNDALLQQFPQLRQQIEAAVQAENAFRAAEQGRDTANRLFEQQTAFGRLLKGDVDDPSRTVGRVLSGDNAVREYRRLAQLTRARQLNDSARADARGGLFSATMDALYRQAGGDNLSFVDLQRRLNAPMGRNQPSPLALMRQEGVITHEQRRNLEALLESAVRAERSGQTRVQLDALLSDPAQLETLLTRIIGSRIGSMGAAAAGGSTLIAASAGSTAAQNLVQRIPGRKVQDLIAHAVQDPAVAARLLRKSRSGSGELNLSDISWVTGAMIQAGILTEQEVEELGLSLP